MGAWGYGPWQNDNAFDMTAPIEETLQALNDLVRAGKVRYIGCSNFPAWRLCEALWTSKVNSLASFEVSWCPALSLAKHEAQGTTTLSAPICSTRDRLANGRAIDRSREDACAAVVPQHIQPFISESSTPSNAQTRLIDTSNSEPVE